MPGRCPLCGKGVDEGRFCRCGMHLHGACYEGHREWCAHGGKDAWVGTQEF